MEHPDKARAVARDVFHLMQRRISLLLSLRIGTLDRMTLQSQARAIADHTGTTPGAV